MISTAVEAQGIRLLLLRSCHRVCQAPWATLTSPLGHLALLQRGWCGHHHPILLLQKVMLESPMTELLTTLTLGLPQHHSLLEVHRSYLTVLIIRHHTPTIILINLTLLASHPPDTEIPSLILANLPSLETLPSHQAPPRVCRWRSHPRLPPHLLSPSD